MPALFLGHDSGPMHLAASCGDAGGGGVCGAEYSAAVVSGWGRQRGGVPPGGVLGMWAGNLRGAAEEVPDVDRGREVVAAVQRVLERCA